MMENIVKTEYTPQEIADAAFPRRDKDCVVCGGYGHVDAHWLGVMIGTQPCPNCGVGDDRTND